jgi:hypothetical protein
MVLNTLLVIGNIVITRVTHVTSDNEHAHQYCADYMIQMVDWCRC